MNIQTQSPSIAGLLSGAGDSLRAGDRENAYLMSLEATRLDPGNIDAWLMRFSSATSSEERLLCLSQVVRLAPDHPQAKRKMYTALSAKLHQNPFLAYIEETDSAYFVRGEDYQFLAVPKDRAVPESYPPKRPKPLAQAYRWLGFAFLGLAVAGLGTLLFAPFAILLSFSALTMPLKRADHLRAWMILFLSGLLVAIALVLGLLFLTHIIG